MAAPSPQRLNLQSTGDDPAKVRRVPVSFPTADGEAELKGLLFLPAATVDDETADSGKKTVFPGVVVAGAWTTVKEQMAGTYARELAARGVAALAFDFRGWGESSGSPRYVEAPAAKTADVETAARYLGARPEVDAARLGGLGICASAGYVAAVAAKEAKPASLFATLALVAPWLHEPSTAEKIYGGKDAAEALKAKSRTAGPDDVVVAASADDATAVMYQAPYYTETDRGLISAYDNKFALASWEPWLTYDALKSADQLSVPTLIVCSDAAALPAGARAYADRAADAKLTQHWLDDVSQFDFYDRADVVTRAAQLVADHVMAT